MRLFDTLFLVAMQKEPISPSHGTADAPARRRLLALGATVAGTSLCQPLQVLAQTDAASSSPAPGTGQPAGTHTTHSTGNPAQDRLLQANPAEFKRVMNEFLGGKTPVNDGLKMDVAVLADNPSAVPVRVSVPITGENWCEELILVAEQNPIPLACHLYFTPLAGVAEAAVRVRLARSQTIHALARMKDGQILAARQAVTVAASGCGM